MDCETIKEYIYPFLDGQLDNQKSHLVKEHLLVCPLCSLELEQEKKVDYLIRANFPKEKASYELKEKILSQIRAAEKKKFDFFSVLKPVVVTSMIIFLAATFLINNHKPSPVFSEPVNDHIQFLRGNLPPSITSDKPDEVSGWLEAKLDFKVMAADLSSQGAKLLGARVCRFKNKEAAYLMYEKNKHNLSVFMFEAKNIRLPKVKQVSLNKKTFYLSKEKGYNNILWIDEGIACVFVSDLGEAELLHLASL